MKLYIDNINSALRGDPESTTEPSLVLFSEDSLPLEIFFFEKTTDEPAVFVDPNPEQILVGVGYQGQLLAFSNSFTKTGSGSSAKWTGTLNLNTQQAAFATKDLLDGTSLSVVLEVEVKTGSQKLTKAQILASLNKDLINETDNLTDVGNVTSVAESHINATTNVHGIANTANLVLTDDARLTNARTPTAHTHAVADVTGLQDALDGKQASGNYAPATGISPEAISGTAVVTNDARLSDARTPTAHTHAISDVTNLQTELNNKQASGTYATLVGGKIPSDQLPSYVDDVLEFANNEAFPATGEIGIIYVSLATNKTFRWSGSAYVEISPSEVTSVNTKTGAVTLTASDVGAAPSTGISPSAITGTAVVTTDSRLSDARTPTAHTHAISDVTNLQTTLDDKASSSHTHSVNGGTAVGSGALLSNSIGINNTAVGQNALRLNTTGNFNAAVGQDALYNNTTGTNNSAVGQGALYSNTTGSSNSAVGVSALQNNTTGTNNSAVGLGALENNTTGSSNSAVGLGALSTNTTGNNNSAVGQDALFSNTTGNNNSAVGVSALQTNTTGTNNSAVGVSALQSNTTGGQNTAVGQGALFSNIEGQNNTAVGFLALQNSNAGHLYGGNTAVGVIALKATTTGIGNTAVGHQALAANTTGSNNTAVGVSALLNNAAENNSAFGYQALAANTTGLANTAVGYRALAVNTTSGNNTAIGLNALQLCTGGNNTAIGRGSLGSANSGNNNVGIGSTAGGVLTTGSENVIIGSGANVDAVNRSRCVVLGYVTTSPAVNGSLAIGGSGAAAMGGLVTTAAPTGATGNYLRIWLNGTEYRIPIQLAN